MPWRRLLTALLTLWVIVTIAFVCLYRLPGDPARMILGGQASAASVAAFRHEAGLDQPLFQQYTHYLSRLFRLDLGRSFALRRPVGEVLIERGYYSFILAVCAGVVVVFLGMLLPLLLIANRRIRALVVSEGVFQGLAFVPPFVLATAALVVVAGWLDWLPVIFETNRIAAWILPALVLSAYPVALVLKLFADSLRTELTLPYARRARAFGFSHSFIVWKEVLPNAVPAAIAALVNGLAYFVTGAFFVEIVFGLPGLGRLGQEALRQKDVALLTGVCLAFAVVMVLLSLLLDLLQRRLSPLGKSLHDD